MISDQGERVAKEIGPKMVGGPHQCQALATERGIVLLRRVVGQGGVADWVLHALFSELAQHRSHSLVTPIRGEDERPVCVGKLQHGGLTQLQLELLKCLYLFVLPLPNWILL